MLFQFILHHVSKYVFTENCPVNVQPFVTINEKKGKSFYYRKNLSRARGYWLYIPLLLHPIKARNSIDCNRGYISSCRNFDQGKISCNVVAGFHHDYFFVPEIEAEKALNILNAARLTS